jgi:hypothetical protein
MNEREVAAWLCQQFSRGMLVFVFEGNLIHILDLCVRHDVAVLDVGITVLLPREACR